MSPNTAGCLVRVMVILIVFYGTLALIFLFLGWLFS